MTKGYDYLAAPLSALRAGNVRQAIQQLEELSVVKPDLVEVQYHLARAWQAAGDEDKARALLSEVAASSDHPFRSHAQAQLTKLGGPASTGPAPGGNTGIVPPHVTEAIEAAAEPQNTGIVPPHVTDAVEAAAEPHNTGIVPPHIAEQVNAEVSEQAPEAPVETAAQDAAPAESAAQDAAPAESAPKGKGKKGKAAPASDAGDPGQSAS